MSRGLTADASWWAGMLVPLGAPCKIALVTMAIIADGNLMCVHDHGARPHGILDRPGFSGSWDWKNNVPY